MFKSAYGRVPNYDDIGRAIAAFERTLVFLDAPFDDFVAGKPKAISPAAQAGWALFNGKARCVTCHALNPSNPVGSDNRFHNIGVAARHKDFEKLAGEALATLAKDDGPDAVDKLALSTDLSELGRFLVSKQRSDIGAFKTPQLRNIALTGPYMHDGSMQTLWDVMDHYNKGGEANAYLDGGIEPPALSETEIDQVVAFMFTLTDRRFQAQSDAAFASQQKRARTTRPFRDNALAQRQILPFENRVMEEGAKEN
jgi:cytochrome c peroxidase